MTTLNYSGVLEVQICWCGIRHAVPVEFADFQRRQHADGETVTSIYCPLGHSHIPAGQGKAERLAAQLDAERTRTGRLEKRSSASDESFGNQGPVTKTKKRVGKGVCPCCNRLFETVSPYGDQAPGLLGADRE